MNNVLDLYEHHSLALLKEKMENTIIILCQGGYFSVGYFEHGKVVIHKSFHRYDFVNFFNFLVLNFYLR
jgi:hypothetical protein